MNFRSDETEDAGRDHREFLENSRPEKPLPGSGIKRLAR